MKKIVVIALRHPAMPNLFLHGLRRDNHRWALAGGHVKEGEADHESARRELAEETGLEGIKLDKVHDQKYGDNHVHLFHAEAKIPLDLDPTTDPDGEFVTFKFLDPATHGNMHVPAENNILVQWMKGPLQKSLTADQESQIIRENKKKPEAKVSHKFKPAKWTHPNGHPRCIICGDEERTGGMCEPLAKAAPKIKVEAFTADPQAFNPKKHDFIVRAIHRGRPVGILAVTHKKDGIMPFNLSVDKQHRRKGFASAMASHAQKISGKKIIRSPDMTQDGAGFADAFIGPTKLRKDEEQIAPEDFVLEIPVTIGGQRTNLIIKDFGADHQLPAEQIISLVDQFGMSEPLDANKLIFEPHELKNLKGEKVYSILIHGLPSRFAALVNGSQDLGPKKESWVPHIDIDEDTFLKLRHIGPALSASEADIAFHPAELRNGSTVVKTY